MAVDLKILLLEDNNNDADLLDRELKKSGLSFISKIITTREEFEDALDNFNPDIILSDYSLPAFDAKSAFDIKQHKRPHIPFIIVSGVIGEENAVELIKKGVTDYVPKNKLYTLSSKIERARHEAEVRKEKIIITERLRIQAAELTNANKELQLFVHISSHDLQEPLRKLQIAASRINNEDYNNLSATGKEQFNRMKDAAQSMQTLIEDILAYAGINKRENKIEDKDLKVIIAEVAAEFKEVLEEKRATIDTEQLCELNVVPFHFRQIMRNLIGNSLKFSDPHRPPRIVIKSNTITSSKSNSTKLLPGIEYCHISFADNGIGFEASYNEKIFDVFQRLHGKEKYKGSGMGLAIVKKIVETQNGLITATGILHQGATFDIYIPSH